MMVPLLLLLTVDICVAAASVVVVHPSIPCNFVHRIYPVFAIKGNRRTSLNVPINTNSIRKPMEYPYQTMRTFLHLRQKNDRSLYLTSALGETKRNHLRFNMKN